MAESLSLGLRILVARKRLGLTQKALARQAGISVATLHRLESGQATNPQSQVLKRLAQVLGVRTDYLLELEDGDAGDLQAAGVATDGYLHHSGSVTASSAAVPQV